MAKMAKKMKNNQNNIDNELDDVAKQLGAETERRLHPISWVFILLDNLGRFSIPFIAYILFATEENLFGSFNAIIIILAILGAFFPIAHFLTYRFVIENDEIRLRWGIINKQNRHIPLQKIHNVSVKQNILHRIANVAEVRLESAGSGQQSEAVLRVLSLHDAGILEGIIAHKKLLNVQNQTAQKQETNSTINQSITNQTIITNQDAVNQTIHQKRNQKTQSNPTNSTNNPAINSSNQQSAQTLLTLKEADIIRYGLISNGGIILGGIITAVFQPEFVINWFIKNQIIQATGYESWSVMTWIITLTVISTMFVIGGKLFSVISAFFTHYNFILTDSGQHISLEKGLLTREKSHVPINKIQVWRIQESLLHRLFKRKSVHIDTAILKGQGNNDTRGTDELLPIVTSSQLSELLARWNHDLIGNINYQPVHPKAWQRLFFKAMILHLVITAVLVYFFATLGLCWLVFIAWSWFASKKRAAFMAVCVAKDYVVWRDGWLNKQWYIAQTNHAHALSIRQSPFDRRYRMATLIIDTVGGRLLHARFTIPFLPQSLACTAVSFIQKQC